MRGGRGWMALLTAVAALHAEAREGRLELGPAYHEVADDIETPHLAWGKPPAGGPVSLLVVAPRSTQRETVELRQRFALRCTAVGTADAKTLGDPDTDTYPRGGSAAAVAARLREAARGGHDAVVTAVSWTVLPPETAAALIARVEAGAGLVFVDPAGDSDACAAFRTFRASWREIPRPDWVVDGSRLDGLPYYRRGPKDAAGPPEKVFACYRAGRGRVAHVRTAGRRWTYLTPDIGGVPDADEWDFEDQAAFVGKLILWAAGRVPPVHVADLSASDGSIAVTLAAADGVPPCRCELTVRDRRGAVLASAAAPVGGSPENRRRAMAVPPLKGGRHRAEVRLLDSGGGAFWWGVWPLDVSPAFGIGALSLDSEEVPPGRPVAGRIGLTGTPVAGARLTLAVSDAFGRTVGEVRRAAAPGAFSIPHPHPLSVYHEVTATLTAGGRVLDERRVRFAVPLKGPGWDDFSFLFWHTIDEGRIGRLISRELREKYCADTIYTDKFDDSNLWCAAQDGLYVVPYAWRVWYSGDRTTRSPCLSDPAYLERLAARMLDVGRRARKFRPPGYSLGDENFLSYKPVDVCFSPHCRASFREYLKERYPTPAALNAEWGTSFAEWAEASPVVKDEAIASGQIPRWVDHRMHMNSVFARVHAAGRAAAREGDPEARVGFDGPLGAAGYNGHDLWKLSQSMDLWGAYPYNREFYDAPRSFGPEGYYGGVWFGGYPDCRYPFHNWPWTIILGGMGSAWWYCSFSGDVYAALAPDFRPYDDFLRVVKEVRRLKSGVGKLILRAKRDDGIAAVYYSPESLYARMAYGQPPGAMSAAAVLGGAGLGWRLLAAAQLPDGLDRFRVLALPGTLALSDGEAAAIRRFVEGGGVLVADTPPGVTDEHGRRRPAGALDDLFEPSPADGRPLAVRRAGRGAAVMVLPGRKNDAEAGAALAEFLRPLGVAPAVALLDAKGESLAPPPVYRLGRALIVPFSGDAQRRWGTVRVSLPEKAWCHLAGEGISAGYTDRPEVPPSTDVRYRVLVGLPYAVEGLTAVHAAGRAPREHLVRFELAARGGRAGFHVLRVEVLGPDGAPRGWYAANVGLEEGRGEYVVPLALNDPRGTWTLTAVDIATGARARVLWTD